MKLSLTRFLLSIQMTLILIFGLDSKANASWVQPPVQFTNDMRGFNIWGATDTKGNALAVWNDGDLNNILASYYSNGAWGPYQIIGYGQADGFQDIKVAMDITGTGLAAWVDDNLDLKTAYFKNGIWTIPTPNPLVDGLPAGVNTLSLSMNGHGKGLLGWADDITQDIVVSFFSEGTWSVSEAIGGPSIIPAQVAYSSNGTAVAVFVDTSNNVAANHFDGTNWQPPPQIIGTGTLAVTGIDVNGNAIAAWIDLIGNVISRTFNGSVWLPPVVVSPGPGNDNVSLAVAPLGTAVLVWTDASYNGQSSSYNGSSWTAPVPFASGLQSSFLGNPKVSVNSIGNALILYAVDPSPQKIFSTELPLGGVFGPTLLVANMVDSVGNTLSYLVSAFSDFGLGFSFWKSSGEGPDVLGSVLIPNSTPASISGRVCKNRFASQTDLVNIISFEPSASPFVTSYYLRRNDVLIAVIEATGPYIYFDHNRCKNIPDVYLLTAVNSQGIEGEPLSITLE